MGTLTDKINYLTATKTAIKTAISNKGIAIGTLSIPIATSASRAFYNCVELSGITFNGMSKVTDSSYMFYNCLKLEQIINIDLSSVTNTQYLFYSTPLLKRIVFTGTTIKTSFDLSKTGLIHDGIVEMFNSLPIATGSVTITLGATKLALVNTEEKLIATNKGYILN